MINSATYRVLPGAIRYVQPEWNEVKEGDSLYPGILYWLGIVKRDQKDEDDDVVTAGEIGAD